MTLSIATLGKTTFSRKAFCITSLSIGRLSQKHLVKWNIGIETFKLMTLTIIEKKCAECRMSYVCYFNLC
jgi:hypothetical protein